MAVKHAIDENKTQVIQKKITESNGDPTWLLKECI